MRPSAAPRDRLERQLTEPAAAKKHPDEAAQHAKRRQ